MNALPRVLVVVVSCNGARRIDACLGSVRECGSLVRSNVVDNASNVGSADHVTAVHLAARLPHLPRHHGFALGRIVGATESLRAATDRVVRSPRSRRFAANGDFAESWSIGRQGVR